MQGTEYHNALLRCIRERVYRYWKKCIQHEEYKCHFKQTVKNFGWGFHWHSSLHWTELACILPLLQGDLEALSVLFSPFSFLAFCYFNLYADWDVVGLWLGSAVIELAGWLNFFFFCFIWGTLQCSGWWGKVEVLEPKIYHPEGKSSKLHPASFLKPVLWLRESQFSVLLKLQSKKTKWKPLIV